MKKDYFWIIIICLIVSVFLVFIIFATDVFAQDDISELGATNIVNVYIDNTLEEYPGEAQNIRVDPPVRVKENGMFVWKVKITYTGNNTALATIFSSGGGYFTIPVRATKNADGTYSFKIRLPNGQIIEVLASANGEGKVEFPEIVFSKAETDSPVDTGSTSQRSGSQSTQQQTCNVCHGWGMGTACPSCGKSGSGQTGQEEL